jgi:hypothetical protein
LSEKKSFSLCGKIRPVAKTNSATAEMDSATAEKLSANAEKDSATAERLAPFA